MLIALKILDALIGLFWECLGYILLFFCLNNFVKDGHDIADTNVFSLLAIFESMMYLYLIIYSKDFLLECYLGDLTN
jgi:hypothetical protein